MEHPVVGSDHQIPVLAVEARPHMQQSVAEGVRTGEKQHERQSQS